MAQTWYHNMEKYWWYRYRLVNDFMIIGDQCGMSVPAQKRNYPFFAGDSRQSLQWEDATTELGHYIGALAVEYRMLKDNHWDTWRTEQELYYAIRAFDRLDASAETFGWYWPYLGSGLCDHHDWGPPFGPLLNNNSDNSLNGYFLRDDVFISPTPNPTPVTINDYSPDFVTANYAHFNSHRDQHLSARCCKGRIHQPAAHKCQWPARALREPALAQ